MDTEELKQEARQKALEWNGEKINGKYNRPPIANWSCYEKGYLAGAEPREKRITELEKACDETQELLDKQIEATYKLCKENAELEKQLSDVRECFINASSGYDFEMAESAREVMEVFNISCYRHGEVKSKLTEAKEIILKLYNAGRDVLMCRAEEKAYDNLDEAINDKSIAQFLKEVEK